MLTGQTLPGPLWEQAPWAAEDFALPRLLAMCKTAISATDVGTTDEQEIDTVPDSTMAADLGALVNDPNTYTDVRFICAGDEQYLYAHRVVLMARSDYFKGMLGQADAASATPPGVLLEIEVPEAEVA